jgi:hypothetical protein
MSAAQPSRFDTTFEARHLPSREQKKAVQERGVRHFRRANMTAGTPAHSNTPETPRYAGGVNAAHPSALRFMA